MLIGESECVVVAVRCPCLHALDYTVYACRHKRICVVCVWSRACSCVRVRVDCGFGVATMRASVRACGTAASATACARVYVIKHRNELNSNYTLLHSLALGAVAVAVCAYTRSSVADIFTYIEWR